MPPGFPRCYRVALSLTGAFQAHHKSGSWSGNLNHAIRAISGLVVRVSIANHQFAGQTANSVSIVRSGAQRCLKIKPIAAASSITPETTISSVCSGSQGGINQRKAAGFTRCSTPEAKNSAATISAPILSPSALRATARTRLASFLASHRRPALGHERPRKPGSALLASER